MESPSPHEIAEQKRSPKTWLTESILLVSLPFLAYAMAYTSRLSYLVILGIPQEFLHVGRFDVIAVQNNLTPIPISHFPECP